MQSSASAEEQPCAPVHAEDQPAAKQLCRKGTEGPKGHQIQHKASLTRDEA